jgi:hypothetical protein
VAADCLLVTSLAKVLSILEKCISYDFTAIMLNDTLEDPTSTHIPSTWRPFVVDNPHVLQDLY